MNRSTARNFWLSKIHLLRPFSSHDLEHMLFCANSKLSAMQIRLSVYLMIDKSKKIDFVFYFHFLGQKKKREGLNSKKRSKPVGLGSLLAAGQPTWEKYFRPNKAFFCFYPNEISKRLMNNNLLGNLRHESKGARGESCVKVQSGLRVLNE